MGSMVFRSLGMAMLSTALLAQTAPKEGLSGRVLDADGNPLEDALVIASGAGYRGWAETAADGTFEVEEAGSFVSAQLEGYAPALIPVDEDSSVIEIRLSASEHSVWKVPSCKGVSRAKGWFGDETMLRATDTVAEGPGVGEHADLWWTVRFREQRLTLVNGIANIHAGLPSEKLMTDSADLSYRGWQGDYNSGLDIRGSDSEGRRWRWVGHQIGTAVSYVGADQDSAAYFDAIIDSMCSGGGPELDE